MHSEPTLDRLLDGRVEVHQPRDGYRAGHDAVLLAAAAEPEPGALVGELGCGVGAAGLCLLARRPDCRYTGIEIQSDLADLARTNGAAHRRQDRWEIITGDLRSVQFDTPDLPHVDHVLANPPFGRDGHERVPASPGRAIAHVEQAGGLEDWIAASGRWLRPKGRLTLIHRADRLDDIMAALHGAFGGVTVIPVRPRAGADAKRVLIRARKGVATPATLRAGLALHTPDGGHSPAAQAILRDGRSLDDAMAERPDE